MSRWAKVPEWLLPALLAAPRDRRIDASPPVALACWVTIAVKYADFRTLVAEVKRAQLACDLDVHPRTIRRALVLLDVVGAASVEDVTARGGQAANRVTLHLDEPGRVRHSLTRASDPLDACVTPSEYESAGQDPWGLTHAPPLYSESLLLPEGPAVGGGEEGAEVIELLRPREEVVQRALSESFERLGREPSKVRHLRAASRAPGTGARMLDSGGAGVPEERGSIADADAEGSR